MELEELRRLVIQVQKQRMEPDAVERYMSLIILEQKRQKCDKEGPEGGNKMTNTEKAILDKFRLLLSNRVSIYKMILFGSRARGDADRYSDMDIAVILNEPAGEKDIDYVSDCAWEAGFEYGIVVVPVVFTREEWQDSPERSSLLVQAAEMEGVAV